MYLNRLINNPLLMNEAGDGGMGGGAPAQPTHDSGTILNGGADRQPNNPSDPTPPVENGTGDGTENQPTGADFSKYMEEGADRSAYLQAMGIPENAEDYKVPFGEDFEISEETGAWVNKIGHEAGIHPAAMSQIAEAWTAESQRQLDEVHNSNVTSLKEEWGQNYADRMTQTRDWLIGLAQEKGLNIDFLGQKGIGSNPDIIKMLHHLSTLRTEKPADGTKNSTQSATLSAEADRIMNDPTHDLHKAFHDPNHPDFTFANKKYNELKGFSF